MSPKSSCAGISSSGMRRKPPASSSAGRNKTSIHMKARRKTSWRRPNAQIFDVVASSLDAYVSEFKEVKSKAKKLTFNLLRYALESNPSSMQFILTEVIGLP